MTAQHQAAPASVKPLKPTSPPAAANEAKEEKPKAEKTPKAPKEPKAPRESNFKKVYPDTAVIHLKVEKNPKREGSKSHGRFAVYKSGMTVAEALKGGVLYADLAWDVGHGFISVTGGGV